jgi:hypothetical protein
LAISPGGRPADASPTGKKPGGPRGLTDYLREVVHALKRKGVPESTAIAIARSQQAKWAAKSKNPAIRAASVKSLADQHVLDHRKKGRRSDMSTFTVPAFDTLRGGGVSLLDLDWSAFDANRPPGQQQPTQQPDLLTAQTHNNIAAFQKAHGLPVTGQIDAKTTAWLNNPKNSAAATAAASGAAKKNAAAATKAQKAAVAAAKKAAAAQTKAQKQAAAQQTATQKANAKAAAASQAAAVKKGKSDIGFGSATRSTSLSVPMVGSSDGARMTGQAFGGKKAAPFVKGGGRAKKNVRALNMENLKRVQAARTAK